MIDIETPRLRLRRWIDADFEPLVAMNADPRVMEFFPSAASRKETEGMWSRLHDHFETHGFGLWAMEVDLIFAGWLGLMRPRFEAHFTPCVEVGYRLRTEFWGRGLATEGARAVLRYGFERLKLGEIVAFTVPSNTRSRRVMEKIGLTFSGDFDHPLIAEGHPMRRHVLYRISRTAWEGGSSDCTTSRDAETTAFVRRTGPQTHAEILWYLTPAPPPSASFMDALDGLSTVAGKALLVPVP